MRKCELNRSSGRSATAPATVLAWAWAMTEGGPPPQQVVRSTADVQALIAAERGGQPFLTGRGEDGSQVIFVLPRDRWRLTVGRKPESDVALGWDVEVSRAHALLELIGDQ